MAKVIGYEESRSKTHPEAPVCSSTHCQVYKTEKALIKAHEDGWEDTGWKKIQKACKQTEGELLYYKGELVTQPLFFSSSGGQTENSEDVFVGAYPYLVSVESPHEEEATHKDEEMKVEIGDFAGRVRSAYPQRSIGTVDKSTIKIISRTAGGRVSKMKIGSGEDGVLTGTEIRNVMGLSSALFSIRFEGDNIVFTSSGSGHGVGMSQYGANGMAKEGYTYREILHHYYSGTEVG
jgi:stage II sporulation protein D